MIDILFCIPGKQFSDLFLQSWSATIAFLNQEKISWKLANGYSAELAGLRNNIANCEIDAGIHFWIDSDMVWAPKNVAKILSNPQDICSGVYKAHDDTWTHKDIDFEGGEQDLMPADRKREGIVEAQYAGFGFIRYDTKILESMDFPYFFYHPAEKNGWDGEDVSWCKNAQQAGHKVYVDYDCRVGHEKRVIL